MKWTIRPALLTIAWAYDNQIRVCHRISANGLRVSEATACQFTVLIRPPFVRLIWVYKTLIRGADSGFKRKIWTLIRRIWLKRNPIQNSSILSYSYLSVLQFICTPMIIQYQTEVIITHFSYSHNVFLRIKPRNSLRRCCPRPNLESSS